MIGYPYGENTGGDFFAEVKKGAITHRRPEILPRISGRFFSFAPRPATAGVLES